MDKMEFTIHDKIRYEFFEALLPEILCNGDENEKRTYLSYVINDAEQFIPDMVEELYTDDGETCPFQQKDYAINRFERGGIYYVQINLPMFESKVNEIHRAYLLYNQKDDSITDYKYFIIKKFYETGCVHIVNVSSTKRGLLGTELTDKIGDMEYEYWKLAQNYCELICMDAEEKR